MQWLDGLLFLVAIFSLVLVVAVLTGNADLGRVILVSPLLGWGWWSIWERFFKGNVWSKDDKW